MQTLIKRLFDIAVAGSLLVTLWPLYLAVAVAVALFLGTPVLFRQQRVGRDGTLFSVLKFRSMTTTTDGHGNLLPDDQRLTTFGKLLRATSLDELPQLWNIFVGDMSFVGPRPLFPAYLPYYTEREATRHVMRPGITGLAQVNGRNAIGWNERLELDAQYVERFSLKLDLEILWRTVLVVLQGKGISAEGHVTMRRLDEERKA